MSPDFWAAGKTTFLNSLFADMPGVKFGIIVNDFGDLGVDAAEIKNTGSAVINELNNGQIFCSCLSGSFIKAVGSYADLDIDYLIVETSGLAKPSPLMEIIEGIRMLSGDRFIYYGMISLVDTQTYLKLSKVLNAVNEQIAFSDLVLLNKTDISDAQTVACVEAEVLTVNPEAELIRTKYGKITPEVFTGIGPKQELPQPDKRFSSWGDHGRPVPVVMKNRSPVTEEALRNFVDSFDGVYYRLKGRIETDKGLCFVDCTAGRSEIRFPTPEPGTLAGGEKAEQGLVIILPRDDNITSEVKNAASEIFDSVN